MSDHDTEYTDSVICPNCGKAQCEGSEYELFSENAEDAEVECGWDCGQTFRAVRHVSVSYSTKAVGKPDGAAS